MKYSSFFGCLALMLHNAAFGVEVNGIIANLMETKNLPGTTITINGGSPEVNLSGNTARTYAFSSGGSFTFNEINMNDPNPNTVPLQNRHEFRFSGDGGVAPLALDGDLPWTVDLDVSITTTFANPRKSFTFALFNSNASGINGGFTSNINLTTSRTPTINAGTNAPPGESAMFGGQFDLQRVIGPCDSAAGCNPASSPFTVDLNPTVGYSAGDTIHMSMQHIPSPDGGTTPAQIIYEYDDGSPGAPYSNQRINLKNSGVFSDGYEMGFVILGYANDAFGTDSYTVAISNFDVTLGLETGDFDDDGDVDGRDFLIWQRGFGSGTTLAEGDGNADGVVDGIDLGIWQDQYGSAGLVSLGAVPEPSSMALGLLSLLTLALLSRGRTYG